MLAMLDVRYTITPEEFLPERKFEDCTSSDFFIHTDKTYAVFKYAILVR
jgi:hypothetical protein